MKRTPNLSRRLLTLTPLALAMLSACEGGRGERLASTPPLPPPPPAVPSVLITVVPSLGRISEGATVIARRLSDGRQTTGVVRADGNLGKGKVFFDVTAAVMGSTRTFTSTGSAK